MRLGVSAFPGETENEILLLNIDVYGIGIGVDVSHLFQKAALIEGVEELAQSLFELSRDLLIAA